MKNSFVWRKVFHTRPFVVFAFSAAPVLNFMAQNALDPQFLPGRSLLYLTVILTFVLGLTLALDAVFKNKKSLFFAFFLGMSMFVTLNGYHISNLVFDGYFSEHGVQPRVRYVLLLYAVSIALCGGLAYVVSKRFVLTSAVLAVVSVMALTDAAIAARTMFTVLIAERAVSTGEPERQVSRNIETGIAGEPESPNVYFILPDMMVGAEIFPRFGVGQEIFAKLNALGFETIDKAYSNAPVTGFSMPHIFGMEYFLDDGEQITEGKTVRLNIALRDNRVYTEFKKRGYKIVVVDDGYYGQCGRGEEQCIQKHVGNQHRRHDVRFLERTPFMRALEVIDQKTSLFDPPVNLWPFPNRMEIPEITSHLETLTEGPKFVYIHLALPHYPFRFNKDCSYRRFDDVDVAYANQLKCTVKLLPVLLQAIIDRDPGSIIVAQSDHGISFDGQHLKPVSNLTDDELRTNLSIFSAYRLPKDCKSFLRPGLTPVNTFRLIFACLDKTEPQLLEDRMFAVYYLRWPSGGQVREWKPK